MHFLRFISHYPLTLLLLAGIFTICLIPIPETPLSDVQFIDKWTHIALYFVLVTVFFAEYLRSASPLRLPTLLVCTVAMPLFIGALIEVMQATLTTCRSGEFLDFVADSVGVALGNAVAFAVMSPLCSRIRAHKKGGRNSL